MASADDMIAALNAFVPEPGHDENQFRLYPITDGFKELADKQRVIPAMFALIERFPDADLGTPGPLVHCIESIGVEQFEPLLIESVRRQPTDLSVWMVNRILNTKLDPRHRKGLLDLLGHVQQHRAAPPSVIESARHFIEYQAKRAAGNA